MELSQILIRVAGPWSTRAKNLRLGFRHAQGASLGTNNLEPILESESDISQRNDLIRRRSCLLLVEVRQQNSRNSGSSGVWVGGLGLGCLHTLAKPYFLADFVVVGVVLETNGKAPLFCRLKEVGAYQKNNSSCVSVEQAGNPTRTKVAYPQRFHITNGCCAIHSQPGKWSYSPME